MKLYGIWWEEEIPLMYFCNDCSKKERERELPAFASFESFERNQSFESEDFCTLQLPHPQTLLWLLWTDLETDRESGIDPGNVKLFWYAEASGIRAFWFTESVCRLAKRRLQFKRMKLDVWGKHLLLVEHETDALGSTCLHFSVQHISQTGKQ